MSVRFIDPLDDKNFTLKYDTAKGGVKRFSFNKLQNTLASNQIFSKNDIKKYNKFSRYGYIDPYNTEQATREFLFFTKPDLCLFGEYNVNGARSYDAELNSDLKNIPFFVEANERHKDAIRQLQYSVRDSSGNRNPFMYLLSNTVSSRLDLPGISANSKESTSNIMGTSIQYRGHSYASDNGYDFSLSFKDTAKLELYTLTKVYDEYIKLLKTGEVKPMKKYVINRIIPEQFSIYKFIIGDDGETILYYAKLTGCYFTDVPRSDMGDPPSDGFKYSISFHAQFVEDNNPMIIEEFNRITPGRKKTKYISTYNYDINAVDNSWVRWPKIIRVYSNDDLQVERKGTSYDYRMKWIK